MSKALSTVQKNCECKWSKKFAFEEQQIILPLCLDVFFATFLTPFQMEALKVIIRLWRRYSEIPWYFNAPTPGF